MTKRAKSENKEPTSKRWIFVDHRVVVESEDPLVCNEIPFDPDEYECFQYLIYGLEKCPKTDKWHFQGYIECNKAVEMKRIQNMIHNREHNVHCEMCAADSDFNYDYVQKEWRKIWTYGTKLHVAQGKRNDLIYIKNQMVTSTIPEMIESGVIKNHQQLKLAESVQKYIPLSIHFSPKEIYWFHGPTGTGKTRTAAEMIMQRSQTWFRCEPYCEWFDGYFGQEIAWFDDYRGSIPYHVLLQVTDGLEIRLKVKGGFVIWKPKMIIFTSSLHWSQIYQDPRDDIAQLARRITETREFN